MKKRIILLFVVMVMLITSVIVYADENDLTFEPALVNALDYSAKKWFNFSENRALITLLLAIDYKENYDEYELDSLLDYSSYVALDEDKNLLSVLLFDDKTCIYIMYSPVMGMAAYSIMDEMSERVAEFFFEEEGLEYHRNSVLDIGDAIELVINAVEAR